MRSLPDWLNQSFPEAWKKLPKSVQNLWEMGDSSDQENQILQQRLANLAHQLERQGFVPSMKPNMWTNFDVDTKVKWFKLERKQGSSDEVHLDVSNLCGLHIGLEVPPGAYLHVKEVEDETGTPASSNVSSVHFYLNGDAYVRYLLKANTDQKPKLRLRVAEVGNGGRFEMFPVQKGSQPSLLYGIIRLTGPGSVFCARGADRADQNSYHQMAYWVSHDSSKSESMTEHYSLSEDQGQAHFVGKLMIPKNQTGCQAHQKVKSLVASQGAQVSNEPILEIYNDDVKCSHGAAVSTLSEDQMMYLQSRGVEPELARKLLIQGFFEPVVREFFDRENVKAWLGVSSDEIN